MLTDGVNATTGARVAANGAALGGAELGRGIIDSVAGTAAPALESVVEADPVASFVGQSLASRRG